MADAPAPPETILTAYVHDRPGVLAKIANIFYRRGLNIRRLTVAPTQEAEISQLVVAVAGAQPDGERLAAAMRNLVDVLSVQLE